MKPLYDIRSEKALFELFFLLPPVEKLDGVYRPEFPGPKWTYPIKQWGLGLLGLPGWQGKQFYGAEAVNLITRHGCLTAGMKMRIQTQPHKLDGKSGLVATYFSDAPLIWRCCTDEFRLLDKNTLVGMTHFDLPIVRRKPMMFVLRRDDIHPGVMLVDTVIVVNT